MPNSPDSSMPDADELGLHLFDGLTDDPGISLEELNQAYAELINGENPYQIAAEASTDVRNEPSNPADEAAEESDDELPTAESEADAACEISPRSILEAMLFVGHPQNEPLTSQQVAALMRGVQVREIDDLVRELNLSYATEGRAYEAVSDGSGYRLQLRPEFSRLRDKFYGKVKEARLTQAAIDVLAVAAYHQGLSREEIDALRGKPSGGVLSQLVRRQLLRIERGQEKPRTPRFFTTQRFLDLFGLENLAGLPESQEFNQ